MTDQERPYGAAENDPALKRVRTRHFQRAKEQGIKITGLTSYDYLSASIFDDAGIDFLLVGDSAGNTVFGYDTTIPVTVDELIPLTAAVVRGAKRALVIADMPFGSYENGPDEALATAIRFMKETGAQAVKLEGGVRSAKQIKRIVRAGIPVMAHIGFTPQSEHGLGGHIIQGRGDGAQQLLDDAHAVEEAGAFAVVLEMVPSAVAAQATKELSIPTISVGAGPDCDGQLLVWSDWAGFTRGRIPQFVKQYASIGQTLLDAAIAYREDVESGVYPGSRARVRRVTRLNVVRDGSGPPIVFIHGMGMSARHLVGVHGSVVGSLHRRRRRSARSRGVAGARGPGRVHERPGARRSRRRPRGPRRTRRPRRALARRVSGARACRHTAGRRPRRRRAEHRTGLPRPGRSARSGTSARVAMPTGSVCRSR